MKGDDFFFLKGWSPLYDMWHTLKSRSLAPFGSRTQGLACRVLGEQYRLRSVQDKIAASRGPSLDPSVAASSSAVSSFSVADVGVGMGGLGTGSGLGLATRSASSFGTPPLRLVRAELSHCLASLSSSLQSNEDEPCADHERRYCDACSFGESETHRQDRGLSAAEKHGVGNAWTSHKIQNLARRLRVSLEAANALGRLGRGVARSVAVHDRRLVRFQQTIEGLVSVSSLESPEKSDPALQNASDKGSDKPQKSEPGVKGNDQASDGGVCWAIIFKQLQQLTKLAGNGIGETAPPRWFWDIIESALEATPSMGTQGDDRWLAASSMGERERQYITAVATTCQVFCESFYSPQKGKKVLEATPRAKKSRKQSPRGKGFGTRKRKAKGKQKSPVKKVKNDAEDEAKVQTGTGAADIGIDEALEVAEAKVDVVLEEPGEFAVATDAEASGSEQEHGGEGGADEAKEEVFKGENLGSGRKVRKSRTRSLKTRRSTRSKLKTAKAANSDTRDVTAFGSAAKSLLRLWLTSGSPSNILKACVFFVAHTLREHSSKRGTSLPSLLGQRVVELVFDWLKFARRFARCTICEDLTTHSLFLPQPSFPLVSINPSGDNVGRQASVQLLLQRAAMALQGKPKVRVCAGKGKMSSFLFVLTSHRGLCRVGTGSGGTILGQVYHCNASLNFHADGYIAFLQPQEGDERSQDVLILRTPFFPHCLLPVDPSSLQLLPYRIPLHTYTRGNEVDKPLGGIHGVEGLGPLDWTWSLVPASLHKLPLLPFALMRRRGFVEGYFLDACDAR